MQSITAYENISDAHLEQFVQNYLPLVKKIAVYIKRKLPSHVEFDDLLQSGLIGLLEARTHFNPEMGAKFETYACIRIRGAIIDFLRKNSWVSRETIKTMKKISEAIAKIEQRDQRQATVEDIVTELGITIDEYSKISQEIHMLHVVSLTDQHFDAALSDDKQNPESLVQDDGIKIHLKEVLGALPEREQLVLSLYYVEELTFKQIGEILDLTEARICQLHSQAISRIRSKMKTE